MKKSILYLVTYTLFTAGIAQPYNPGKINKKAVAVYTQAMQRAEAGNLIHAAGLLLQSIEIDNKYLDAYLSLAGVYGELKNYTNSIANYEKAFLLDSNYSISYKLPYSINLAATGEFEKALIAINELLAKKPPKNERSLKAAEYRQRSYQFAVDYAKKHNGSKYVFAPQNMGDAINSTESEYFPSLTIDEKEFVFTRKLNGTNEDFFSSLKKNNDWTKATAMQGNVNTPQNEGAQNISLDGQMLVFTACLRPDGLGSCDIYISYLEKDGWSEGINAGRNINTDQWESQPCLSPDKRDLYFASRRPGGYGGSDIYVSHLQANGKWGEAENLGPEINTAGDEQCPFIHADNQTLYFTSNFWPGYGDDDLFFIQKNATGAWANRQNLGYPINTINKEGTLFITANGKTAYYASDKTDTKGGLDIYSFELREDIRPYKTNWVKGKVADKKTLAGLPATVELIDLASQQIISKLQTDEQGNYLVTLPTGKDYVFNVNKKGYLFYSDNFSLQNKPADTSYEKNILLHPIEANASITLNNIFFDLNKFDLKPASAIELNKVVQLMNDNPTVKIEISGHTDNVGKPADNIILSNNRAKTVVAYLINKRIAPARLTYKGLGQTQPVADNKTEEGKAKNRRTELKILSK